MLKKKGTKITTTKDFVNFNFEDEKVIFIEV